MTLFTFSVVKIFLISSFTAIIAIFLAPFLIKFLYKIKFWKKEARTKTITGEEAEVFYSLHKDREVSVPRGGGLIIWCSVLIVIFLFYLISKFSDIWWLKSLNFLSRGETWLPLFTLITASLVGLTDDILQVFGKGKYIAGGMAFKRRMLMVILIGAIGAWWFYSKLGWDSMHIPLVGDFSLGIWYVLLFIITMLACWSSGVVDGIDGLAGGVFASIFGAFAVIAFSQGKVDLAAFCIAITGTLFAFLWFNIPPAKFYMGETGILGLTTTLAVVAFLTNSLIVLPIIGGLLVIESGSVILQLLSKKFRKKKIWLCTPIHHHFEAKGWLPYKVTMRFWIIGIVLAIIGTAIRLLG
ncbi:hypothetical protein KAU51_00310 [Candidatus Parcubacteria bacterium]|nr:hypothetical protein [Candidatus Parcubacteria bacterium]